MPIDASIPLQVQGIQPPDMIGNAVKGYQLKGLQMDVQEGERKVRDRELMQRVIAEKGMTPEGINEIMKISPEAGMELQKNILAQQKDRTAISKDNLAIVASKNEILAGAAGSVFMAYRDLVSQGVPEQQAIAQVQPLYERSVQGLMSQRGPDGGPIFAPEELQGISPEFNPMEVGQVFMQTLKAKDILDKQMKEQQMKVQMRGQDITVRGQDMTSNTAAQNRSVQMRGQDMSRGNAQLAASGGGGFSMMAPEEVRAAGLPAGSYQKSGKGEIKPISAPGAGAVGGGANATEQQAASLGARLQSSMNTLTEIGQTNKGALKPEIAPSMLPDYMGISNLATSGDRQRAEAAQLDALDAALTLATGAAYTKDQLQNLRKSYFPQIGDSKKTVEEKNQRFQTVINSARIRAGRAEPMINKATAPNPKRVEADLRYQDKRGAEAARMNERLENNPELLDVPVNSSKPIEVDW